MNKRTAGGALCAVAALSFLMTACGGDSDSDSKDKIAGAGDTAKKSASPSASDAAPDKNAPTFDFPKDLKVAIDQDTTGDATKDVVLRDHGYAVRATLLGYTKQDPGLPQLGAYLTGKALLNYEDSINEFKKSGKTLTGSVRYYHRSVKLSGKKSASVEYCEDQRRAYDKDVKTDKVNKTKPSANSFVAHTAFMTKAGNGTWQMSVESSQRGAAQCRL